LIFTLTENTKKDIFTRSNKIIKAYFNRDGDEEKIFEMSEEELYSELLFNFV
jgi:hypothetical protein